MPDTLKGRRLVGAFSYYHCHCGEPRGPLLQTGFEGIPTVYDPIRPRGVLLSGDGALFLYRERFQVPCGVTLIREVGRVACSCSCADCQERQRESGDHVWYDWEFEA